MSIMSMQIDDIYRSNILNNVNRRKLSSFSDVLKRKYLTLQRYKDQLIDIRYRVTKLNNFMKNQPILKYYIKKH